MYIARHIRVAGVEETVKKKILGALACIFATAFAAQAQDAKTVVQNAMKAMGGANLKTLEFSGSGSRADQLKDGNTPGPRVLVKSYTYDVDYTIPASRLEAVAIQGIPPMQTIGEEGHGLQYVNAGGSEWYAWDVGGLPGLRVPARPKDWLEIPFPASVKKPGDPVRQPDGDGLQSHSEMDRVEQIWLTPHGFLIGAMKAKSASVTQQTIEGKKYEVVSWTGPNEAKITGYIGPDDMVSKVETMMDHPMYGDEHVVRTYDYYEYRDGIQFPAALRGNDYHAGADGREKPGARIVCDQREAERHDGSVGAARSPRNAGGARGYGDDPENRRRPVVPRRTERLQPARGVQGFRRDGRRAAQ